MPPGQKKSTCPLATQNTFPSTLLYDEIVTIRVGAELKPFIIHKGLLCHHSAYFKTLSNGRWPQSDCPVIELPEDDPQAWQALFNWLYTRDLQVEELKDFDSRPTEESGEAAVDNDAYLRLCEIYVLGDVRQVPAIKNAAVDALISLQACAWMNTEAYVLNYAYENTPEGSQLREILVDWASTTSLPEGNLIIKREDWQDVCTDFWGELVMKFFKLLEDSKFEPLDEKEWASIDKCQYHDHTDIHATATDTT